MRPSTPDMPDGFGPATKDERDASARRYFEADERFVRAAKGPAPFPYQERKRLGAERRRALDDYYESLPRLAISRCPVCNHALHRAFDPWGVDGFWWQEKLGQPARELPVCPHFRVLTGALNLESLPPRGGREEAFPGPEVPYVVPRLLGLASMIAVVSSLRMANGYRAYPIAYFSDLTPKPGTLTQTWTQRSYNYRSAEGEPFFKYDTSPWDFELLPWIERGNLVWIGPDDPGLEVRRSPARACPYLNVPGRREPLAMRGNKLRTLTLPAGETINPFSE